jgi:glycosyltransferase involved in cell wall biosynthesis
VVSIPSYAGPLSNAELSDIPIDIQASRPLTALIVVPTLDAGAAEAGAVELVRILAGAAHHPIVVSRGGRMQSDVAAAGGEFLYLDVASKNPAVILRNAAALARLIRERCCDVIHAHGRAPAWSAYLAARLTGVPLLTTWYKGFREQNVLKHFYNGIMVRGQQVVAASDQIAELINDRYGTPWDRIVVIPASVDTERFDPATVSAQRMEAVRRAWGVAADTKIVLIVGRMLRRKGHHVTVEAARRLKALGMKNFICVFAGEEQGASRYARELWDQVLASDTADVVRMVGWADDLPAAYAVATVVVSAAIQADGAPHVILEAQAMGCPVIVSDMSAGPELVLAPPGVTDERMTGLRFSAGDDAALAAGLVRLFSMPSQNRIAMGARGRDWVLSQFAPAVVAARMLRLYAEVAQNRRQS